MFYSKAFLMISAVSALPISQLRARQTSQLVPPELIPQTCSWQCGPAMAVADNCQQDDSGCVCTASVASNLQYCLNCFWTQSSQANATGSWMSTAVGWANDYNLQCREAGFELPAVVAGGNELAAVTSNAPRADDGSPAVPRVSPPGVNTSPPAPVVPSSVSTPTPTPSAPSTPSSTPVSTPSASTNALPPAPPPTTSPAPTPTSAASPSASGLGSTINIGSQTITIVGSSVPVNIPGNNASDSSSDAATAAAAAANAAHRSMVDIWIAVIVGTVSVGAAIMF